MSTHRTTSRTTHAVRRLAALVTVIALALAGPLGLAENARAQGRAAATPAPSDPWPRPVKLDGASALIYQPQVDSWQGNTIEFRAVVAITPAGAAQPILGVIWATAHTKVDRIARMVALTNLAIAKSDFPTLPDKGSAYLRALQQ